MVMTAAHCLYNPETGYAEAGNITFALARNGDKEPYGRYRASNTVFLSPVDREFDNNFDLAFIVLQRAPLPASQFKAMETVPIGVVDERHFKSSNSLPLGLLAGGYPNLAPGTMHYGKLHLSASTTYRNSVISSKDNQFEHKAISKEGTSGGPIFAFDPLYGQFALVGVISAQRKWNSGETWAVGIKINHYTQDKIIHAIRQYDPDFNKVRQASLRSY